MTNKTKAKVDKTRKAISGLTEAQREKILFDMGVVTSVEGHIFSPHNTIALVMQGCRDHVVAGYNQWRKAGRQVRRGESGFVIWFPTSKKSEDEENSNPRFYTAAVFAQSQTDLIEE